MALAPGSRVGAYEVVSLVGAGGMGEVYSARDARLVRTVALKVLPDTVHGDPERLARFAREAQVLASLNHPNIAQIYGFEESASQSALVMEFVDGETLADRLQRGPVALDDALAIARQILSALESAHAQGIVHRDLKPANIKVSDSGAVKVLDFGLAKAIDDPIASRSSASAMANSPTITSPAMTMRGVILGTAAYMSPEQAKGKPVDRRADMWAFGCVLFEMLTARRAFEGDDVAETLAAVLTKQPDWSALPPKTPSAVRQLLQRCLDRDIQRRVPDASVARWLLDEPAAAVSNRSWRTVGLVLAASVVGLLVGISATLMPAPTSVAVTPSTLRMDVTSIGGRLFATRNINMAVAPDGRFVVFPADTRPAPLLIRWLNREDAVEVPGSDGARLPIISPDGNWIAFTAANELRKLPLNGGAPIVLASLPGPLLGAAWPSNDRIVADIGNMQGLQVVPSNGGALAQLTALDATTGDQAHAYPAAVAGRNQIIFTIVDRTNSPRLVVKDLDTGRQWDLLADASQASYVAPRHVLFMRRDRLWVARLDEAGLEVVGDPMALQDRVAVSQLLRAGQTNRALYAASSNGVLLYVPASASDTASGRTLVWVDAAGRQTPIDAPARAYRYARVSPDGSQIALAIDGDIWLWSASSAGLARLTFDDANDSSPLWSPDSRRVIFMSNRAGAANIWSQNADGSGAPVRLTHSANQQVPLSVSNDGMLLFREDRATGNDLLVMSVDGGAPRDVLRLPPGENNADLSPDGKWIAYQSAEGGAAGNAIVVRPFPNVDAGRWQLATRAAKPRWGSSGRELFFMNYGEDALMRVSVASGAAFRTTAPPQTVIDLSSFFNAVSGRPWDLSSDGRRALMIKNADEAPQGRKLVAVLNWIDELEKR